MIESNLGDDGAVLVFEDVSCVVSAAHANFHNSNFDIGLSEDFERGRGEDFEFSRLDIVLLVDFLDVCFGSMEDILGYWFLIDGYAVPSEFRSAV